MIKQAVQSALTSKRIRQLVFFDNSSTDDSLDVIQRIAADYPDLNFVIHKRDSNLGTVRNFKDVYLNSSEYYFAWLATDDYVCDGYYDKLAEVLDSSDEGFCAGATIFLHPDGQQRAARSNRPLSGEWHCRLNSFLTDPCENQWCYGLFRREQVATAILSLNDRPVSDWFMMMRLLNQGEFQFRADCQVYRRKSATQNYFSAANSPFIYRLFHETFKGSKNERHNLIEILSCSDILKPLRFDRKEPGKHDWDFALHWRGEDKYDRKKVNELFEFYDV